MTRLIIVFSLLFSLSLYCADEEAIMSYPLLKSPRELPEDCLFSKSASCLISTEFHSKFNYNSKQGRISLGSQSSVLRRSSSELHFVQGELWWSGSGKIKTEFGIIECIDCEAFLYRTKKQVAVRSLKGQILLHPNKLEGSILVPNFTENWMGGVSLKQGHSQTGIPAPFSFRKHLRKWAQFYAKDKQSFKAEVEKMRRKWAEVVHESSQDYKNLSSRRIASHKMKRAIKKAAKVKKSEDDKVFKDMLRRRAFTE